MKYLRGLLAITFMLFITVSCEDFSLDLNVENLENPDDDILTSDPVAVEATASGILNGWYLTVHSYYGPGAALQTMADASTCSWGNMAMNDLSGEPRSSFNNYSSYTYSYISYDYFNALYSVLYDANTVVSAVNNDLEFDDPDLVEMIGRAGQAISVGYLAMLFDRVWISDENGSVYDDDVDYEVAMEWALDRMDEAIAIAETGVTITSDYLPVGSGTASTFAQFLNSMAARMLVCNVRNSSEKASIDWDRVYTYASNGLTDDYTITMDDSEWYNEIPATYLVYPSWGRVDMRVVNLMDPNTPAIWPEDSTVLSESTSADARLESDYSYLSSQNFNSTRGSYHYSSYRYSALDDYITSWDTDLTEISASENDMYKAEALLNLGSVSAAAEVVNSSTRVTRGGLDPVEADADEVQDAIFYERMVEFAYTGMGISFFEMRKEDLLQEGTMLHFPIPGKALESLEEDYYTYGGTSGTAGEDYSEGGWELEYDE